MSITTPSTERASHHLEQFIHAYNEEIGRVEILESDNEELQEQVIHLNNETTIAKLQLDNALKLHAQSDLKKDACIKSLEEKLSTQAALGHENLQKALKECSMLREMHIKDEKRIKYQESLLLLSEQNSHEIINIQKNATVHVEKIKELQKIIKSYKGDGDPKRLKKQIITLKKKVSEHLNSIASMRALNAKYSSQTKELVKAHEKVIADLKSNKHNGIADNFCFKDGPHHLYKWSDESDIEQMDGSLIHRKVVLYMHENGRGSLIALDDTTDKAAIFKAPKGGLRLNKAIQDEATRILNEK